MMSACGFRVGSVLLWMVLLVAACRPEAWRRDPDVQAAKLTSLQTLLSASALGCPVRCSQMAYGLVKGGWQWKRLVSPRQLSWNIFSLP
jgi:hypothetical protein